MKVRTFLTLLGLASCGGDLAHYGTIESTNETGAPNNDGGASPPTDAAQDTGMPRIDTGASQADAIASKESGAADAVVACMLPPPNYSNGGQCTFCNNKWYCPQPQTPPEPPCPQGVTFYSACTFDCIECGSIDYPNTNIAWFWQCTPSGYTGVSHYATCTPP